MVRTNSRKKQDLLAQCTRYEIEHKEIIDEMVGQARVQEMEAKSKMDVLVTQAKGNLEVATAEGQKEAEEIRRKMQIKCDERRVKVAARPAGPPTGSRDRAAPPAGVNSARGAHPVGRPGDVVQLRRRMNNEINALNFPPNFERLVLGCIDADFCK